MAKLFLSKEVNERLNEEIAQSVDDLKARGIVPTLATIRVGENDDDIAYEKSITKKFEKLSLAHKKVVLDESTSADEMISVIQKLNADEKIHGILIFKPLPKQLDDEEVTNAIAHKKDVDGITDISMAKLYKGDSDAYSPCTAEAVIRILKHYGVELSGKNVVVIGRSLVIGRPLALMLVRENATVTICHSKTKNLSEISKKADIIVTAAGSIKLITKKFVSPGQILIDVGIHVDDEGKLVGDVNQSDVENIVSALTPVPGGVGGVTTGLLALATIKASSRRDK